MKTETRQPIAIDEAQNVIWRQYNSYDRLPTLIAMAYDTEYVWDWLTLLGDAWSRCDNISIHMETLINETPFQDLLSDPLTWRDAMMDAEERAALALLPEVVTIYRGCYANNKDGLSWSLDRDVAEQLPLKHRYTQDGQPLLIRATIARDDILALKLDRSEREVIAWQPKVRAISHIRAPKSLRSAS